MQAFTVGHLAMSHILRLRFLHMAKPRFNTLICPLSVTWAQAPVASECPVQHPDSLVSTHGKGSPKTLKITSCFLF
jgi:hypothetical protein